jgi:hypothetical protein
MCEVEVGQLTRIAVLGHDVQLLSAWMRANHRNV